MTKIRDKTIVTFDCQKEIFVYERGSGFYPPGPYKSHPTIDDAIDYMEKRKIYKPNIITYKKLDIDSLKK